MSQTLVSSHIKPHLVPFLFMELSPIKTKAENKEVIAARVTGDTSLGKIIRLLCKKSVNKIASDKTPTIYFLVEERAENETYIYKDYKGDDGRSSFLYIPKSGERLINAHLERIFETALFFHIHSWNAKTGKQTMGEGILVFLEKYNLEEYNYNMSRIKKSYYRKVNTGYFDAKVTVNPVNGCIEV
jgi:hypothetical protein